MYKVIIYVICYDDASEIIANTNFKHFEWARIYRIPEEAQNHLFCSVMYHTELMKVYEEWKDKDYVGTIGYKTLQKMSLDGLKHGVDEVMTGSYDFIPFLTCYSTFLESHSNNVAKEFETIKNTLFDIVEDYVPLYSYANYWVTRPRSMLLYIEFFNNRLLPHLDKCEHIWENAGYHGSMSAEKLLQLTKRVPHYPFHPFLAERVVSLFFDSIGAVSPQKPTIPSNHIVESRKKLMPRIKLNFLVKSFSGR